jgi:flagellar biosynthesis/type III secretory pathway protein FliH
MWEQSKRADEADHRLVAAENGQVMMIDVQEHRNEAYQSGWNDGYAEGAAKAIADARLAEQPAPAGGLRPHD